VGRSRSRSRIKIFTRSGSATLVKSIFMTQKLRKNSLPIAFTHTKKVDKESFIKAGSGSGPRLPDPTKRSGSGSATLLKGQLISVAEPHHFYASSAPGKNLCGSGSNPTVSVADPDPDIWDRIRIQILALRNDLILTFYMCKSHKYFRNLWLTFWIMKICTVLFRAYFHKKISGKKLATKFM
jgi:hypothetical protein